MTTDLYVLEWSKKAGMPHVQRLEETLSANRKAYRDDKAVGDYIPIAVGTVEEMSEAADAIRPTLMARRPNKAEVLSL
jgi:hypothetical protein